jgi:hypothetical protein
MNTKQTYLNGLIASVLLLSAGSQRMHAVEGGLGRPISGVQINPYAGIIPPAPGFSLSVGETYYDGSIGGSLSIPVASFIATDLDAKLSFTPITLAYLWNTGTNRWNFASAITVPILWTEVEANVEIAGRTIRRTDEDAGLFDLFFTPIIASHHFSPTEHLALSFSFWAPTGDYESGQLANLSLNNWTFIPGLAYTKIYPKRNIEISTIWSAQFYTENSETDYENGILSDLEVLAVKRFKCGAGLGLIGSWIEQLTDDEGTKAEFLNGFRGRAFGVGPILTYSRPIGKHNLDFNARWIHEFENRKRLEGDVVSLNLAFKF